MPEFVCQCVERGVCPIHNVYKVAREVAICRGGPDIPDDLRASHLRSWGERIERTPAETEFLRTAATVIHATCPARREFTRTEVCPTCCGGGVRIKVFACSKHGECQIGHNLPGVAVCDGG